MTDGEAPASLQPGTVVSDRYRVEALLGQGAMGAVYRVEHVHMRKRMALKVLLPEVSANEEVVARFEREAMAAAHLEHPNVVAATDFGRMPDGAFFLVLEYVEGESVREALARPADTASGKSRFTAARAINIAMQVASALSRAHAMGVVHRDLKPDNIMLVAPAAGDGRDVEVVKVLDFGIAKMSGLDASNDGKALTQIGAVFGTPEYMAPEQAMGQVVDGRADLYALGVTLYEMLTGVRPFEAESAVVLLTMHVTAEPTPMSVRCPEAGVPPELEGLVMQLLAKNPGQRPASAEDVEAALASIRRSSAKLLAHSPAAPTSSVVHTPPHQVAAWSSADSAAKTSLPGAGVAIRPASSSLLALASSGELLQRVTNSPRAKLLALALAGALGLVILLTLLLRSHSSPGDASPKTGAAGGASSEVREPTPLRSLLDSKLSDAKLAAAAKGGVPSLIELERDFPSDPRVPRELVHAAMTADKPGIAMAALGRLAKLDIVTASSAEMDGEVENVLARGEGEPFDAAVRVLEGPLGAHGVDLLMDHASETQPAASRARFQRILKKPEVRAHASPAALVALDLRDAKTCEARRELLPRVQEVGDERSLAIVQTYKRTRGCGFLGTGDCFRCMRKDKALDDALSSLEARR